MGRKVHIQNMSQPASPAHRIVAALGARRVAEISGVTTEAVRKWQRKLATAGGGGLIPARYQAQLLRACRSEGLNVCADDLIGDPY